MIRSLSRMWKLALRMALLSIMLCACSRAGGDPETAATSQATLPSKLQRADIQTLLVVCLDEYDVPDGSGAYRNDRRADLLMVMVIDEDQGKTTALQVNPDALVSYVPQGASEAIELPLGQVFSYGSGGSDSCLSLMNALSGLLGGVKLDHYMTFTTESIAVVNDMLGGIRVGSQDASSREDQVLTGQEAVEFFRLREDDDIANKDHMDRQQQYMTGLYGPFLEKSQDEDFLARLMLQLGENISTDLTLSQMTQMMQALSEHPLDETILTLSGTARQTDGEYRFDIDASALARLTDELFYE